MNDSYYGRPILKRPVWKWDIPAYFFTGGVMAGSSMLALGADVVGNRSLRRAGRVAAAAGLTASTYFLIHDLGRPERFFNMLRIWKPTSPMNMGSWLLAVYGPAAGAAAASDALGVLPGVGRVAGAVAGATAPLVASYTAVLTADTAVPSWHDAYRQLPFVYVGSAAAASGGIAMAAVSPAAAGPARRLAVFGAAVDVAAASHLEHTIGMAAEPYRRRLNRWARRLTVGGALGAALFARRSRLAAVASGAALAAGSACTRFAVFQAGVASTEDPAYVVAPQRARAGVTSGSAGRGSSPRPPD